MFQRNDQTGIISILRLSKNFGGLKAVDNVSINIPEGSITGLIGPNGAGKTTLFNTIAGLHAPTAGTVLLDGEDITGLKPHQLFAKGLLRTFQVAHEYSRMSVIENLMMVPAGQSGESLIHAWFHPVRVAREEDAIHEKAREVIDFLNLGAVADELAGNLSGGQKKLLELGRTMMVDARIVFLDEVGAGVNRTLLRDIGDAIIKLNREKGYTFCMIEHDMEFIRRLCGPVICMAEGAVLATGSAEEVQNNEEVIEAYLGRGIGSRGALRGGDDGWRAGTETHPCNQAEGITPPLRGSHNPRSGCGGGRETGSGRRRENCALTGEGMVGGYAGGDILKGCTVNVDQGEIAVIVGPNGAGKSTAMKALLGMLKLKAGSVRLNGEEISHLSVQERIARGIAFTPQTDNIFRSMSVRENLEMGAFLRTGGITPPPRSSRGQALRGGHNPRSGCGGGERAEDETLRQIYRLFPALAGKKDQLAGELSGGQRQQVAVGRALMSRPSVLLLDEPTAGVSPIVMDELFARILEVRKAGVPVLMVEQNARQSLAIADIGFVLVMGENRHTDTGQALLADPEVRRSFLGG